MQNIKQTWPLALSFCDGCTLSYQHEPTHTTPHKTQPKPGEISGVVRPWAGLWTPLYAQQEKTRGRESPFGHATEEAHAPACVTSSVQQGRHRSTPCFAEVRREFVRTGKGQTCRLSIWQERSYKYCDTCLQEPRTTSALTPNHTLSLWTLLKPFRLQVTSSAGSIVCYSH